MLRDQQLRALLALEQNLKLAHSKMTLRKLRPEPLCQFDSSDPPQVIRCQNYRSSTSRSDNFSACQQRGAVWREKNEADLFGRPRFVSSLATHLKPHALPKSQMLEHDLRAELHDTRGRVKAQEVAIWARRRSLHGADGSVTRIRNCNASRARWAIGAGVGSVRQGEVRVIEHVERLRANREVEPFPDLEILEEVQVHIEIVRSAILITAFNRIRFTQPRDVISVQNCRWCEALRYGDRACVKARIRSAATAGLRVANDRRRNRVATVDNGSSEIAVSKCIRQSSTPEHLA